MRAPWAANEQQPARGARLVVPRVSLKEAPADPVLRLVVERARARSRPGARSDGVRLALAIEGGGMAGAVTGGMCAALEALGLIDSFDAIYGSSAGALNASYTAAGEARSRVHLYLAAARAGIIDPRRVLRGRPPFRLAELFGPFLSAHPHASRVLEDRPALRLVAARVDDKALDVLGGFQSVGDLRTAVWASCAIPALAGDVVDFGGRRYVDGGLLESLPYGAALRDGATHVLVLRSRPPGYRKKELCRTRRGLVAWLLRDAPETVAEMVHARPGRYNAEAARLQTAERTEIAGHVVQITPPECASLTSQVEARPERLVRAIRTGVEAVDAAFAADGL